MIRAAGYIFFFYGKGDESHHLGTGYFVHHRIVSAVMRVEFVGDRMSHTVLRGCWSNIIVLNVHAPNEEKSYESKDSFYEELEQVFDQSRLKSGNACNHLVPNPLFSSLLPKSINIKTDTTVILPVALNGCETWSFTLRVFENRCRGKYLGLQRTK